METINEFHQEPTDIAGMETLNIQDPMFPALEVPFDFSTMLNSPLPDPTFWDTAFQSSDLVDTEAAQDSVASLGFGCMDSLEDIDSLTLYDWGVGKINPYLIDEAEPEAPTPSMESMTETPQAIATKITVRKHQAHQPPQLQNMIRL